MIVFKNALATISGCFTGVIVISLGEYLASNMYPLPADIDFSDKVAVGKAVAAMPMSAFMLLLFMYAVAAFCGAVVATLISKREQIRPALIAGIVLSCIGIYATWVIPHPLWFTITDALIFLPAAYLGYVVSRKKTANMVS